MLNKLVDWHRIRIIRKHIGQLGIDVDGDIVWFRGTMYYVNVWENKIKRIVNPTNRDKRRCDFTKENPNLIMDSVSGRLIKERKWRKWW